MTIHCIAIDDNPLALTIISEYCRRMDDLRLDTYTDPAAGVAAISAQHPPIVLLDIEMGDANGLRLARQLPPGTCVIFTTAYAQYAVEGFEVDAVDFLTKPFSFARFQQAIGKARQRIDFLAYSNAAETLVVMSGHRNVRLSVPDICYVEASDNYVQLHLTGGRQLRVQSSLTALLGQLPRGRFLRIHKSYAVPLARILSYTYSRLTLSGVPHSLPVGRTFVSQLKAMAGKQP